MSTYPRTSGTAIASLVFGVLSWVFLPFIGAVAAVIFGHVARSEIRRSPAGSVEGDGMALAGLILGWAHLIVVVGLILMAFVFFGGLVWFTTFIH